MTIITIHLRNWNLLPIRLIQSRVKCQLPFKSEVAFFGKISSLTKILSSQFIKRLRSICRISFICYYRVVLEKKIDCEPGFHSEGQSLRVRYVT